MVLRRCRHELRLGSARVLVRLPNRFCRSPFRAELTRPDRNSGFLRYWRPLQLPNFLLAGPVLALSFASSYAFYAGNPVTTWQATLPFLPVPSRLKSGPTASPGHFFAQLMDPAMARRLVPFVHLSTFITSLLFFAHHVQIILRVVVTNPVPFWYAAELVLGEETDEGSTRQRLRKGATAGKDEPPARRRLRWGKLWARYCIVWGTVSIVLWAVFLPPA